MKRFLALASSGDRTGHGSKSSLWARAATLLAVVALAAFHAELLAQRVADGTLWDPVVAAQWLGALGLGLVALRFARGRVSLGSGRRALAFWLLVLVLHALPGATAAIGSDAPIGAPADVALLAPVTALLLTFALLLGARARLVPAPAVRRRRPSRSDAVPVRPGIVSRPTDRGPPA